MLILLAPRCYSNYISLFNLSVPFRPVLYEHQLNAGRVLYVRSLICLVFFGDHKHKLAAFDAILLVPMNNFNLQNSYRSASIYHPLSYPLRSLIIWFEYWLQSVSVSQYPSILIFTLSTGYLLQHLTNFLNFGLIKTAEKLYAKVAN